MRVRDWKFAAAAGLVMAAACGDAGTGTTGSTTTTITAVVAIDSSSGTLSLTIQSASLSIVAGPAYASQAALATVDVTGTLTLKGATTNLTGTYDTGAHTITVSGGGYSFTGSFAGGVLSGTFTLAGGSGAFSGQSSGDNVQRICGQFVHTNNPTKKNAVFDIVVDFTTGTVTGVGVGGSGVPSEITGTVSGSTISVTFPLDQGGTGSASGTISGTSLTGTFTTPEESGTLTGGACS